MPIVTTTGPDGETVTYDPEVLILAITTGKLAREPEAEEVAGALVLAWLQGEALSETGETAANLVPELRSAAEDGRAQLLSMKAPEFVAFLKSEPDFARGLIAIGQVTDGQHRTQGRRNHRHRPGSILGR